MAIGQPKRAERSKVYWFFGIKLAIVLNRLMAVSTISLAKVSIYRACGHNSKTDVQMSELGLSIDPFAFFQ